MTLIRQWVKKYELYGVEGLEKKLIPTYDGDFKKNVVEYMHANHLSAIQTSIQFNLGNPSVVLKWERIYYEEGPEALLEERRGRKNMGKKRRRPAPETAACDHRIGACGGCHPFRSIARRPAQHVVLTNKEGIRHDG